MEIIYIDSLFALNFMIDYLLLLVTGRICARALRRGRIALGAVWGGVYAVCAVLKPEFFAMASVKLLSGMLAVLIAYGLGRSLLRAVIVFFAVSAAFAGAVYAACTLGGYPASGPYYVPVSAPVLVLSFALCYAAISLVFRRSGTRAGRCILSASVALGGRQAEFPALFDSGNELIDPLTGREVLIAEYAALTPLLGASCGAAPPRDPLALFTQLAEHPAFSGRLRIVSCRSISGENTLLPCFTPDAVTLAGEKCLCAVAIAPSALCADGEYRAIINHQK